MSSKFESFVFFFLGGGGGGGGGGGKFTNFGLVSFKEKKDVYCLKSHNFRHKLFI